MLKAIPISLVCASLFVLLAPVAVHAQGPDESCPAGSFPCTCPWGYTFCAYSVFACQTHCGIRPDTEVSFDTPIQFSELVESEFSAEPDSRTPPVGQAEKVSRTSVGCAGDPVDGPLVETDLFEAFPNPEDLDEDAVLVLR